MTRILLVQLADIGDLILTTPAIVALRHAQPDAHLTLLTTTHSVSILEEGLVDEVLTLDRKKMSGTLAFFQPANLRHIMALRQHQFDTVVFFHHFTLRLGTLKFALMAWATSAQRILGIDNGNGWFLSESIADEGFGAKHQAQYWLDLVGLLGVDAPSQRAQVAFSGGVLPIPATQQKRVIIHTGSGGYSTARRWLPHYFAQVADALSLKHNAQVIFVGTPNDGADAVLPLVTRKVINLVGKTSLPQLADLIRSADLYIGADSGVMHLAAAVRVPMIAIFGSSNHAAWSPWSPNAVVLRSAPLCSPCSYVQHRIGAREGCSARTCMAMVTPQQVLDTADLLLNNKPIPPSAPPRQTIQHLDRREFLRVAHDSLTFKTFLDRIEAFLKVKTFKLVVLSDYQTLLHAQDDSILQTILGRAHLVVPCGTGLIWASNWQRADLPERLIPLNLVGELLENCAQRGWKVFLVGRYALEAQKALLQALPKLRVVGASPEPPEKEDALVAHINASGADIVLTAYGTPHGEKWLARNSARLGVKVGIEVGDVMLEIADRAPKVPEILDELRLGWAYLLVRQPKRLRAIWRVPRFVWRVVSQSFF
jgi:heptosyltransferase-2